MIYTFNRGTWEDSSPLIGHDEDSYEDYLKRNGFSPSKTIFGVEYGSWIELYESGNETFLASVTPTGKSVFDVYLPDFPSLMMFLKDYGTAFSAHATSEYQLGALALSRRLFKATHGHSPDSYCEQCNTDPLETLKAGQRPLFFNA